MTESEEPMPVEKRLDKMGEDLQALRVLYEHHDSQIQRIAEVQLEHGKLLGEIKGDLAPLRELRDFVRRVAENHESRIVALEQHGSAQ